MRRFFTLVVCLLFAVPFGTSIAGCHKAAAVDYCNGENSGLVVGQLTTLTLEPRLTGISLNQGQIGTSGGASGADCKGTSVSSNNVLYGSSDLTLIDVQPSTGRLCAGTWNRQTGGGIPDYTVCTPGTRSGTAFLTASSQSVTSNSIPIYVHPIVTSIVLGAAATECTINPASNCYNTQTVNGACLTTPLAVPAYDGSVCLSQGHSANLVARAFAGTTNISCLVGPLSFTALNSAVVAIDTNGLATATQPGSSVITAANSQSSSTAGFFSTCPPQSISLTTAGATTIPTASVPVPTNTAQAFVATVLDTQNNPINNLNLTYVSTSPTTIPTSGASVTPVFPGAASISALCQPPACNAAPFNILGLYGNGTPVTSNPVQIAATGTANSTVLYIASTGSQYLQPIDFTVPTQSAPIRLPYVPNSMVLSTDLSTLYLGSSTEIMVLSTTASSVSITSQLTNIVGNVLAVSPDSATVVVTDPTRNLTYLITSTGAVNTEIGGVGLRAAWTADSSTVYITTTDGRMLIHTTLLGWQSVTLGGNVAPDVTTTVPNAGVYLAGSPVTARTNCPVTTVNNGPTNPATAGTGGFNQTTSNLFYPIAGTTTAAAADRVAATNDGVHILGANVAGFSDIVTNVKSGGCPVPFTNTFSGVKPFTAIAPTAIVNVLPTSDSAYALVPFLGSGGAIPQYTPATGTLTSVALQKTTSGTPVAPVSGVISTDNQTAFIGTSGDNVVHRLARGATGFTDSLAPVIPALVGINGGVATPDLLQQKPRKATN